MDLSASSSISSTESVCPVCFARISAEVTAEGHSVFMRKVCPSHGAFQTVLWRGSPRYETWARPKIPFHGTRSRNSVTEGCPFDCGLCTDHRQQTCTALIEVTSRCNLHCAYCFADSGSGSSADLPLSEIRKRFERLLEEDCQCNVQISGGEPTVRDDLPDIVALGRSMGFEFIQLNTNGLRLAADKGYLEKLKEAGLSSLFLQFDGTRNSIYRALRGGDFLDAKVKAIEHCRDAEIGVVLVPTLVPRINLDNVGEILSFAMERSPVVRGVHFQPVTYLGRHQGMPQDEDRITLPEVMQAVEAQSAGRVRVANLLPPGCEHALCSFHGSFVLMPGGEVKALSAWDAEQRCCCTGERAEDGAARARRCVAEQWSAGMAQPSSSALEGISLGEWDVLLERARTHKFSVSAMAFQDVWNLDLERLKYCCIHVAAGDGKLVPFCAYNLTNSAGRPLYRGN